MKLGLPNFGIASQSTSNNVAVLSPPASLTLSLLHFDGIDTGTVFLDEVPGLTWTPTAMTTSSAKAKFGSTSGRMTTASLSKLVSDQAIDLSSDFTIEMFLYILNLETNDFAVIHTASTYFLDWVMARFAFTYSPQIISGSGSSFLFGSPGGPSQNAWNHLALTKSGSTLTVWVDGSPVVSGSLSGSGIYSAPNEQVVIGDDSGASGRTCINGFIDEFRISSISRYSAPFTPTASPFTPD